jgi:hypothetical protein
MKKSRYPGLSLTVVAFTVILAAIAVYTYVARPWFLHWGATEADKTRPLPGDDVWLGGVVTGTRAIDIDAPPEKVWPWLVQLGQDRAGFYSYTWLENLVFADIHNSFEIRPEWQERKAKDIVPSVRHGYLFGFVKDKEGYTGWKVQLVEPNRALTLKNWGSFVLEQRGEGRTRFLARSKAEPLTGPAGRLLVFWLMDPAHFIMEKTMMKEIKRLAEGRNGPPGGLVVLATLGFAAAALGSALIVGSRKRRGFWLLLPAAYAVLVLQSTSDLRAALVGFTALALVVLGFAVFGRRWWIFFGAMLIYAYAVLFLAADAFLVFGLVFLAVFGGLAALAAKGLKAR